MSIKYWFRVPVQILEAEPEDARGWIYLLGQWHIGATPGHNEIRRALGWGAGRVQKFIPKVAKWALLHGASVPEEIAEHFRSSSGAVAEHLRSDTGAPGATSKLDNPAAAEQERSTCGALAEHLRSDSRARDPFKIKREEEREEKGGEPPLQQPRKESPPEAPGASGGASTRRASPESNQGHASPVSGASVAVPAEGDLLPLLSRHLQIGYAAQAARSLHGAGICTVADAAPMDEWDIGQVVGAKYKAGTVKALREGGWLPPKERNARPATLPALPDAAQSTVKKRTLFNTIGKEEEHGHQRRTKGAS